MNKDTAPYEHEEPLTVEQVAALNKFAAEFGRNWKNALQVMWMNGKDDLREDGCYLRQVRNQGQTAFQKFKATPISAPPPV